MINVVIQGLGYVGAATALTLASKLRKNKRPLLKSKNIKETIINLYNKRIKFYEKSNFSIKGNNREEALSIVNSNS